MPNTSIITKNISYLDIYYKNSYYIPKFKTQKVVKMRKVLVIALAVLAVFAMAFTLSCNKEESSSSEAGTESSSESAGSTESASSGYEDGVYFAQEDGFNERTGWKYMVTLEVEGGKIVSAEWNGAHVASGTDKITRSESGEYGMVENGGAQAPWFEQAAKAEAYLLETQDPAAIEYSDDEGHTDAISGVSIHVIEFFSLAEKALDKGPVGYGMYKDGHYHAEEEEFAEGNGWKYMVDITVVSGYIVSAYWNGVHLDGGNDKKTQSKEGEYGMVENGEAQWPWYEQAQQAEAYLLETQDPTAIEYSDDEGHTDAISGVSIHVVEFFSLAEEALEGAKR